MSAEIPGIDYKAVLADLERRRRDLDTAIEAIRPLAGQPGGTTPSGAPNGGGPVAIGRHEFVGKSTPEAVKAYLQKAHALVDPRTIAQAMVDGGQADNTEAAYVNVYSALKRMRANGEAVKVRKEWGLSEHFPGVRNKPLPAGKKDADDEDDGDETLAEPPVEGAA